MFRNIVKKPGRLFAVGDIHGCPEELSALLDFMANDQALTAEDQVIFIGDYVDRGPDAKAVVDLLLKFRDVYNDTVFLKGNHEEMMLSYLGLGGDRGKSYLMNGGNQTLMSFNLKIDAPPADTLARFPKPHLEFFKTLEDYVCIGDYIFAHAGLNPTLPFDNQCHEDLYWIRNEFIGARHTFGKTVVFGHTPYQDVMFDHPYKIAIDTGLVYGNLLSCIELVEGHVFQVGFGESVVRTSRFGEYSQSGVSRK